MASSMPAKHSDNVLRSFIDSKEPNEALLLAVASPTIHNFLARSKFKKLNYTVFYARYCHDQPLPGHTRGVEQFTNASIRFSEPGEANVFNTMLSILRLFDEHPFWLCLGVVLAQDYQEAQRVRTFLEQANIFCYLSTGFPAPATRRRLFERDGLVVIILCRLGGELDYQPDVMVTLHPPSNLDDYANQLKIGAHELFNLCTIDEETSLRTCLLRNTMEEFAAGNDIMPRRVILPAGLKLYFLYSFWFVLVLMSLTCLVFFALLPLQPSSEFDMF